MTNTTTMTPAEASTLYPWEDRNGEPVRCFRGTAGVTTATVDLFVEGMQTPRGVVRTIILNDVEITAEDARVLVAGLGAVLDEVEVNE